MLISMIKNISISELVLYVLERKLKIKLPINAKLHWKANIGSEIRFWDKCFETKGLIWPGEFGLRFDPNLEIQKEIIPFLPDKKMIKILDVGAGPLTFLGKRYKNAELNIIAVDPLADIYDKILEKYSVRPLIRTEKLDAVELSHRFSENSFDIVVARNSIDHSYSPIQAILEMLKVVRRQSYIVMLHKPNEATNENWRGLHQWNFSEENGDFIISNRKLKVNFSVQYENICTTTCSLNTNDGMLMTKIFKK